MPYQYVREPLTPEEADRLANACETPTEQLMGFFAYPPEKVYSSDQTARSGGTGIWSNCWMSAGRSMVSGALRNS